MEAGVFLTTKIQGNIYIYILYLIIYNWVGLELWKYWKCFFGKVRFFP